jgi:hypothetical protein
MDSPESREEGAPRVSPKLDAPQFPFPADVLERIRAILGPQATDLALRGLQYTAHIFRTARVQKQLRSSTQRELADIARALERVVRLRKTISTDAIVLLSVTFDWEALRDGRDQLALGQDALAAAIDVSARALTLVQRASRGHLNKAADLLAYGVVGAFVRVRHPLSKWAEGEVAQVFTAVWNAVEPDGCPDDVMPYVRPAVDHALQDYPQLRPRKGRRRRSSK